jgi:hypothetical protein
LRGRDGPEIPAVIRIPRIITQHKEPRATLYFTTPSEIPHRVILEILEVGRRLYQRAIDLDLIVFHGDPFAGQSYDSFSDRRSLRVIHKIDLPTPGAAPVFGDLLNQDPVSVLV